MIEFWKKMTLTYPGIFITSFLQVILVTTNTYQIANQHYIGMSIVGFFISFLWTFNVSSVVFGSVKQRVVYGLGGMCGCLTGGILTHYFYS